MKRLIEVDIQEQCAIRIQSTPLYRNYQTHEQIKWTVQVTGESPGFPDHVCSGEWSDGENSIYASLWGNQSGAWGVVVNYFPVDGWPKTKKFEWKRDTEDAHASAEVTAWLNATMLRS